jgi:AraC-like DNA-binding protein
VNARRPLPAAVLRREAPRGDYAPYPPQASDTTLDRLMEHLTVRGVTAVWFRCLPGWTLAPRTIPDDMFLYIVRGALDMVVDGRAARVSRGACAHFRRAGRHQAAAVPAGRPLEFISLHYSATVFDSLTLAALLDFPDELDLHDAPQIERLLADACRIHARRPAGHRCALEALATRLLFHVTSEWTQARRPAPLTLPLGTFQRLLPALEAMRGNLAPSPSIGALAQRCAYSESQFRRRFRQALGVTPVQYQRQVRIERACALLRDTSLTVDAIAAAVGYAETAFFAHTFRRLIGMPPGRYRTRTEV